jgi:hypothetical protein
MEVLPLGFCCSWIGSSSEYSMKPIVLLSGEHYSRQSVIVWSTFGNQSVARNMLSRPT